MSNFLGIGNDIIEIKRIKKACKNHEAAFIDRVFTQKEQEYCNQFKDPYPYYAARFCAKEAIAKALRCGIGKNLAWTDIEITHDSNKRPLAVLSEKAHRHFNNPKIHVSLSHSKEYASAIAIWTD